MIDCDPKGDHRFHLLEEVAPHVEQIVLRPDPALRGVLDPLRVAPEHLRQEAAVSFLRDLLPGRSEPAWETAIVGAVDRVLRRSGEPTCGEVVGALREGDEVDAQVAKTLEVYARSGLTQLGFADPAVRLAEVGSKPGHLPADPRPPWPRAGCAARGVLPGRARGRATGAPDRDVRDAPDGARARAAEGVLVRRGLAAVGRPGGRQLLASLQRMGRSELAVPIISTQLVTDALVGERSSLENLLGATFAFGMRSEAEAARALALLGLDPEDRAQRAALLELRGGTLPVPRPPRARRGDPGGGGRAGAAARL